MKEDTAAVLTEVVTTTVLGASRLQVAIDERDTDKAISVIVRLLDVLLKTGVFLRDERVTEVADRITGMGNVIPLRRKKD